MTLREIEAAIRASLAANFTEESDMQKWADALKAERERIEKFERDFAALSRTWEEHPEGWEHLCDCETCRSYSDLTDIAEGG